MTKLVASLLTAWILSVDASSLRTSGDESRNERKLQLAESLFNSLIEVFTPDLSEWLQTELNRFDPLNFGEPITANLGDTTFNGACPGSYANITYGIGSITGISDVNIHRIQLVENTQNIDVSFMGLDGATWSGDWLFDFSFPVVTAETTVVLNASLCGFPINQSLKGVTKITDPAIVSTVKMTGETNNIVLFGSSSQVTSAVVQAADFSVGNVTADFGMDGNVVQNLNVAESLEQQVLTNFSNSIEPLMINVANVFLENLAPWQLDGSGSGSGSQVQTSRTGFDMP